MIPAQHGFLRIIKLALGTQSCPEVYINFITTNKRSTNVSYVAEGCIKKPRVSKNVRDDCYNGVIILHWR